MNANVSVFVPHNGCKNQCSFCNQFSITSQSYQPTPDDVRAAAETALRTLGESAKTSEIAFFGGSFTAVRRSYMISLLEAAYYYVERGLFRGIRLSTRPDAIDEEVLGVLKSYGVTTIELGAQSMVDSVLVANRRGHTAADVGRASGLIKAAGFALGLQMMTGLYTDTDDLARLTAQRLIALHPDCVRIYPTVVLKGTMLEKLYLDGVYKPQTVDSAAWLCCDLLDLFEASGIPVIRLGLHTIDTDSFVAGAWHPAFGEICEGRRLFKKMSAVLTSEGEYIVRVSPRTVSKAVGHKRENIERFNQKNISVRVLADSSLPDGSFSVEEVKR